MPALPLPVAGVIPARNPAPQLPQMVRQILAGGLRCVVVVDDGSAPDCARTFEELARIPGVRVLRHATNCGKGAALKTGLNFVGCEFPEAAGVVTADADGQHAPEDVVRVAAALAAEPGSLVLGARRFGDGTPWRSRVGNLLTRWLTQLLVGRRLQDTQTGLRGIPRALLPVLLTIPSNGYEFELDMLIAGKHRGVPVREVAIRTIYAGDNRCSHFNPLLDSMRIYFVLLRFSLVALLTAAIDNSVFAAAYLLTGGVAVSQAAARLAAMGFNFTAARDAVFLARSGQRVAVVRYLLLVAANGLVSYALIRWMHAAIGAPVLWAKLAAESLLFFANFALQRDFVFAGAPGAPAREATDWTAYYEKVAPTARLTRRYTGRVLRGVMRTLGGTGVQRIVEFGGANSCFVEGILARWPGVRYHAIDTNGYGLDLLRRRYARAAAVTAECGDVRSFAAAGERADVVFSVGLIEHFDPPDTERAIRNHFRAVRENGLVILSFPTRTWLYAVARSLCEAIGVWRFPDERPLDPGEVLAAVGPYGTVEYRKTLWPLVFTQHLIAVRATSECVAPPAACPAGGRTPC